MPHSIDQLLGGEQPITLLVQSFELAAQILDLELRQLAGEELEHGPLQLVVSLVPHQPIEDGGAQVMNVAEGRWLVGVHHPGMRQGLRGREAILWPLCQQLPHQVLGVLRDRRPEVLRELDGLRRDDLRDDRLLVVPRDVEGVPAGEHLAEDDADAEDVRLGVVVPVDHLGGHVVRSPRLLHHLLALVEGDQVLAVEGRQHPGQLPHGAAARDLDLPSLLANRLGEI
mmetsp:Transcript_13495/g.35677  ORF Transcript_13495/g.35677 Transcript_13495/m.35677 type:complete len:227 (+) Transcript_13495:470-1150(+)